MTSAVSLAIVFLVCAFGAAFAPIHESLPFESYYFLPFISYLAVLILVALGFVRGVRWQPLLLVASLPLLFIVSARLPAEQLVDTRFSGLGLFPAGDADDFFSTIGNILGEGIFDTPRGRPAVNAFWTGLLASVDFGLRDTSLAIGLLCLGVASACALSLTRAISVTAAGISAAILFDFAHEFVGAISSEMVGFLVGSAGGALLILAAHTRSRILFLAGFATLSAALLLRPGPMFLIPLVLIWGVFWFASGRLSRLFLAAAALLALFVVVQTNGHIVRVLTPATGGGFVNAVDSWYVVFSRGRVALGITDPGDVINQTRWRQIYIDHPTLEEMPRDQQTAMKKEIIVEQLTRYPLAGVIGALIEYEYHLVDVKILQYIEIKVARYLIYALFLTGLVFSLIRFRRNPLYGLAAASALGLLLSIPFMHGAESRGFAAAISLVTLICTIPFKALAERPRQHSAQTESRSTATLSLNILTAAIPLLYVAAVISSGVSRAGYYADGETPICEAPLTAETLILSPQSGIALTGGPAPIDGMPTLDGGALQERAAVLDKLWTEKSRLRIRVYPESLALIERLQESLKTAGQEVPGPITLIQGISLSERGGATYLFPLQALRASQRLYPVCIDYMSPIPLALPST